jgi:flagellar biosynthesis protein FlhF
MSLVLTKLDESRGVGGLLDVILSHPIPLSWMTTGQDIPHDIVPANKGLLLDMMLEA